MTSLASPLPPVAAASTFVPAEINAADWSTIEPLYRALVDRPLKCESCLEQLLLDRSELDAAVSEARATLYIRMTCNTTDDAARTGYLSFVENVAPPLARISFELDRKIASCPHKSRLPQARYAVLLRDIDADVSLFRDENVPLQTEDTKLGQQYSELCGAMTAMVRGEEKTMPQAMKLLEETDRSLREEAWRALAERRLRDRDRLESIFDEMIRVRTKIARNAGFDNYRDYAFKARHRFDYTPRDCEQFHAAAAEVCVPLYRKVNDDRRKALGLSELRPWDLAVDVKGRPPLRPFTTADELVARTSRMFHRLDASLGSMFDSMRDGTSLDLDSRKGKAPGGYQESFDRQRRPFIFMNAAGTQGDVETMVHEAGHAFHSILSREEPLVHYRHPPLEFAEVASMSMELLVYPTLDEFYDRPGTVRARRTHLENLSRILPWIATIDAFQHWIYTHPDHTREERRAQWLALDERLGPRVSWTGLENVRGWTWHRQLHLFEVPFYYIEYGIAQLGALQLWLVARKDPKDAVARYRRAMTLGGSRTLPDLFAAAGLKFDFGPATVRTLMEAVGEELASLKD